MNGRVLLFATMYSVFLFGPAIGGEADVVGVQVSDTGNGTFRFAVTVRHDDAGWDHYADQWEIVAPDGSVLGTRVLLHPHVEEQPFTRSLSGVAVPEGVETVTVRARDSQHGWGGQERQVQVPR